MRRQRGAEEGASDPDSVAGMGLPSEGRGEGGMDVEVGGWVGGKGRGMGRGGLVLGGVGVGLVVVVVVLVVVVRVEMGRG